MATRIAELRRLLAEYDEAPFTNDRLEYLIAVHEALPALLDVAEAAVAFDLVADEQDDYAQSPAREAAQKRFRAALATLEGAGSGGGE